VVSRAGRQYASPLDALATRDASGARSTGAALWLPDRSLSGLQPSPLPATIGQEKSEARHARTGEIWPIIGSSLSRGQNKTQIFASRRSIWLLPGQREASARFPRTWGVSALAYELSAQDKTLDRIVTAIDLLVVVRESNRLNDRALLQGLVCPFHL
jgi:hypothetical protein